MKLWIVATADNISTDIDLSVPFMSKENACEQMASEYRDAVERYFECEVSEDLYENLNEEDEANISDTGFSVYHYRSQNLEFGRICEIEVPDPVPSPSRAAGLAAGRAQRETHSMANEIKSMKDLWARAGVTFHLTNEEERKLFVEFKDDMQARSEVLKNVILEGRFEFDGECYSPANAIKDYNRKYGTSLPEEDIDYCW